MGWRPSCQVRRRQLVTKLASYRPAAEQGAEVGQARSAGPTPHLCYLWPLCRLPSTPTIALTLPLATLPLKGLLWQCLRPSTGEFSCSNNKTRHFN